MTKKAAVFYYDEPRLRMSWLNRLTVRVLSGVGEAVIAASAWLLMLSEIPRVRFVGLFLALLVLDNVMRSGRADRPLRELPRSGRVNLAVYLNSDAWRIVERAYGRARLHETNFMLEVLRCLLDNSRIQKTLKHLDTHPGRLHSRLEALLKDPEHHTSSSPHKLQEAAAKMVKAALYAAVRHARRDIGPADLLEGLAGTDELGWFFHSLALSPEDIGRQFKFSYAQR